MITTLDDLRRMQKLSPIMRKHSDETWHEWIGRNLKKRKFIARNEVLDNYQHKLATKMSEMKIYKGWRFEVIWLDKVNKGKKTRGADVVYLLKKAGKE